MDATQTVTWKCDLGTRTKLEVLQRYLGAWFNILAVHGVRNVIYFDGFCGPGEYEDGTKGSPVLAAQLASAAVSKVPNFRVHMICVDKRTSVVEHLKAMKAIRDCHPSVCVDIRAGEFAREISSIVNSARYDKSWPIFSFVDPFGFSGFSQATLQMLMRNQSSEVFVNLFCGFMNRFVNHPDDHVRQCIADLIGSENITRVSAARDGIDEICNVFGERLNQIAPYVRRFMMRDENNTRDNALFFCGRNERGLEKIKEAMWKVDPISGAHFSEHAARKDEAAPTLFQALGPQTYPLRQALVQQFAGRSDVAVSEIESWTIRVTETFLPSHMRSELEELHKLGRITYLDPQPTGRKRRAKDWPGRLLITFRGRNV